MRKVIKLKRQTKRRQNWRLYLRLSICRLYANMTKFGDYSIEIVQIDDEIKEKLNFSSCTISLLVSRSDMPDKRCFSVGGIKNQLAVILESFGTTEEIIISLTRLPSTTYSLLFSFLLLLIFRTFIFSCSSQSSKIILSQILTKPQSRLYQNYSKSNFDLAAKRSSSKIF